MQQDLALLEEQRELDALVEIALPQVVVADDLEPPVEQRIVFDETVAASSCISMPKSRPCDGRLVGGHLDQRTETTCFAVEGCRSSPSRPKDSIAVATTGRR